MSDEGVTGRLKQKVHQRALQVWLAPAVPLLLDWALDAKVTGTGFLGGGGGACVPHPTTSLMRSCWLKNICFSHVRHEGY